MADYRYICLGCMSDKGTASTCPHCGWVDGTPAEAPQHLPPGMILHEKYLLGRVLGHGGFGITYLAWDLNLDMKLAIKEFMPRDFATRSPEQTMVSVFTGGLDTHFEHGLKKFLDEAKTLAQFNNHPGIVGVRDFFRENGTAYLVMYYLEGIDFKQYLETQGGKIPFQTALQIMLPVMDALREVHRTGTLHRDISPDNIYITIEGQVKVLDFGAARHAINEFSKSISVILKPGFAPEEQYRSKGKQGPWTDVYATAATLYRAIVGHVPPESLDRLEEDSITPPSKLGVEIPEKAELALMKALSVKAMDRYQTMEEFQQDLLNNVDENVESAVVKPSNETKGIEVTPNKEKMERPSLEQPKKKALSKWVWIGSGAAVAILLAVGIIGSIFFFGSISQKPPKQQENKVIVDKNKDTQKIIKQVMVPNLINSTEQDAIGMVESNGLKLGDIKYVESLYAKKGVVMNQSLKAEQKVKENDVINLEVSKGIELPVDMKTVELQKHAIINEYWDKGYKLDQQNKLEEALTYYTQARDMAAAVFLMDGDNDSQYSVGVLDKNIALIKRDLGYFEYALHDIRESVTLLESLLTIDPDFKKDPIELANSYGELSYIEFLNQLPNEAVHSAEKALELDPNNNIFKVNLAHAYLFSGQYDAAVALYTLLKDEKVNNDKTFKEFILEDFKYFRKEEITHPDMEKIEEMYSNENAQVFTDEEEVEITIYANGFAFEDEDVAGYMGTIDPNIPGFAESEKEVEAFFTAYDNITVSIESIEVLEISSDKAIAKVIQTLTYTDGSQNYESKSTLIHHLIRSNGIYKWLIQSTEVEGG